jgi:hypothetical protein
MGDHYVPRAYLRGFCEKGTEMIFAYEKGSRRSFRTNIVNVAQERNYYPKDVEKRLASEVEDPPRKVPCKRRGSWWPQEPIVTSEFSCRQPKEGCHPIF